MSKGNRFSRGVDRANDYRARQSGEIHKEIMRKFSPERVKGIKLRIIEAYEQGGYELALRVMTDENAKFNELVYTEAMIQGWIREKYQNAQFDIRNDDDEPDR